MAFHKLTKSMKLALLGGLIFILVLGLVGMWRELVSFSENTNKKDTNYESITNDEDSESMQKIEGLAVAVMLDNFSASRPVTGLEQALIVYEAPVEADITRFLAIYDSNNLPDKIGPVRSARPYFVDWASEFKSLFIHAGGSPEALRKISRGPCEIYDLDEISSDGIYFWRDPSRVAPYNLYISESSITQAIKNKNISQDEISEWSLLRKDELQSSSGPEIQSVQIEYREQVRWQFDESSNSYLRFQKGRPYVEEEGEQIKTRNLIIQETEIVILDEIGRRFIRTTGQGKALIFQNGKVIEGTWCKPDKTSRTTFYDAEGEEIKFLPGPIWIEVVSVKHELSAWH